MTDLDSTAAAPARATRHAYRDRLVEMLARHPRVVCLDTDTGLFTGVDLGPAAHRFISVGIAEHNLMTMAAGLAASGFVPFVNTMATFAATRVLEAVKIDIAYPGLPVRIMATHGGLSAGHLGPTHQSLEDLAVMRALPNMTVVVPADADATEAAIEDSMALPGPLYLRLGRKATPAVPAPDRPRIGVGQLLRPGRDVLVVCCGPHPVRAALGAATGLDRVGVSTAVLNMHTVKPLDAELLVSAAAGVALVVTVEEHWRVGGLGSAVAETLAERAPARVLRIGVEDTFVTVAASHDRLAELHGLDADAVAGAVLRALDTASPAPGQPSEGIPWTR